MLLENAATITNIKLDNYGLSFDYSETYTSDVPKRGAIAVGRGSDTFIDVLIALEKLSLIHDSSQYPDGSITINMGGTIYEYELWLLKNNISQINLIKLCLIVLATLKTGDKVKELKNKLELEIEVLINSKTNENE